MTRVRIRHSYFETDDFGVAQELFGAGQVYDLSPASQRQVELGNGELVIEEQAKGPAEQEHAVEPGEPQSQARPRLRTRAVER